MPNNRGSCLAQGVIYVRRFKQNQWPTRVHVVRKKPWKMTVNGSWRKMIMTHDVNDADEDEDEDDHGKYVGILQGLASSSSRKIFMIGLTSARLFRLAPTVPYNSQRAQGQMWSYDVPHRWIVKHHCISHTETGDSIAEKGPHVKLGSLIGWSVKPEGLQVLTQKRLCLLQLGLLSAWPARPWP